MKKKNKTAAAVCKLCGVSLPGEVATVCVICLRDHAKNCPTCLDGRGRRVKKYRRHWPHDDVFDADAPCLDCGQFHSTELELPCPDCLGRRYVLPDKLPAPGEARTVPADEPAMFSR